MYMYLPFLILKVRCPAIKIKFMVSFITGGYSNEFKCMLEYMYISRRP